MKSLKAALVIWLALCAFGCKERVPDENTPAFYKLHGVVNDGKMVNEITLINDRNENHPKLRFPPEIPVSVYTPDTHNPNPKIIRKGFAYEASVILELDTNRKLVAVVRTPEHLVYDTVEIRFRSSLGSDNSKTIDAKLQEILRLSPPAVDRSEWGLKEYTPTIAGELQGYEYLPSDSNLKSVDGRRIWIRCDVGGAKVAKNQGPAECASHFDYRNGLSVVYVFRSSLLPYWQQIYDGVVKFSDFVLVE